MFKWFTNWFKPWYRRAGDFECTSLMVEDDELLILGNLGSRSISISLPSKCVFTDEILMGMIHANKFKVVEEVK